MTTETDLLRHLAGEAFHDAVAEIAADMRRGADPSVAEIAARLGLAESTLIAMAGAWLAAETGQPVIFMPQTTGRPH